jgi:hypothetical protein
MGSLRRVKNPPSGWGIIDLDPWSWKLPTRFSTKSLQSKIPQLINVSITITSISKDILGQVWKETPRSLIIHHLKPSCVFGCTTLRPSWCITLSVIIFLVVSRSKTQLWRRKSLI